ncbi:MAG: CoA transferase [Pseudomonadota bacterium]
MTPLADLPRRPLAHASTFLEGIRVLDLTSSIAGPYGTQLLGDLGASVVKVERAGLGDDARSWGPPFLDGESLWYLSVNRNKQGIALDYGTQEGDALLRQLVRAADVVVVNLVNRVQRKLRLDYESLRILRPDLIHASVTGFGLEGERADRPCYDLIAEGYSGVMDLTGEAGGPAQKVGTPAADLLAGQDLALAVVAAVARRQRTGEGACIDIALVESMTRFMSPRIVPYLGSGEIPHRSGGRDSVIAIYQSFDTADHPLTLGLGNDGIWERFWAAAGDLAFGRDARFATNAGRREHRPEIVARISILMKSRTRSEWLKTLAAARIPAGPIYDIARLVADPELQERGMFYQVDGPVGPVPQVGLGIRFDGKALECHRAPPRLGEHTEEVLASWLSLERDDMDRLRMAGAL